MFEPPTTRTNIETICQYDGRQSRTRSAEDLSEKSRKLNTLHTVTGVHYKHGQIIHKKIFRELSRAHFMG